MTDVLTLKQTLLATNNFIDNKFLDNYVELVFKNIDNITRTTEFTEAHHFIPVSYYKYRHSCTSRTQAEKYSNADTNNFLVLLNYKDHCIAHYLLCNCTTGSLKYAMKTGYAMMCKNKTKDLSDADFEQFEQYFLDLCTYIPEDLLYVEYITNNLSLDQLAAKFNLSIGQIRYQLKRYSIIKRPQSSPHLTQEFIAQMALNEEFIKYATTHSQTATAEQFNLKRHEVQRLMKKLGISNYSYSTTEKQGS